MIGKLRVAVLTLAGLCFAAAVGVSLAGRWLVVETPLQAARAIVVLGGHMPFRAIEAADLYKQGWAPEVWITQGTPREEDVAMRTIGVDKTPEDEYSRRVIVRLGVPEEAVRTLAQTVENTAEELQALARELGDGNGRLIIVTSKFNGRRVNALWRRLAPGLPAPILRVAPGDPFQPEQWWRSTRDAEHVFHEWFGLLNAWTGLPMPSVRPEPD